MHATERERVILGLIEEQGFISFQNLSARLSASSATLRRDVERLQNAGKLVRVRGGVRSAQTERYVAKVRLQGVPFDENKNRYCKEKAAIGKVAAELCRAGDAVIIDGGSTTLQMCRHLGDLQLQVLTNSLHIVGELLQQPDTTVLIPGGTLFREQNIVLDPFEDVKTQNFHAARMYVGAAAVGRHGPMQSDIILIQAERKLLRLADELVVLVDSSKFKSAAGHQLCELSAVHTLITDDAISDEAAKMVEDAGIHLVTVPV